MSRNRGPRGTRNRPAEEGAAAVEFAIVVSLFFMLVFGIIDFGFGFYTWNGVTNAAREGARKAAVTPDVGEIEARVREASSFLDQSRLAVSVSCSRSGSSYGSCSSWEEGDYVRVTVDYNYSYITPLPSFAALGNDLGLRAISEARFEGA